MTQRRHKQTTAPASSRAFRDVLNALESHGWSLARIAGPFRVFTRGPDLIMVRVQEGCVIDASELPPIAKVPRLVEREINRLIEKGETEGLAPDEQAQLDEALDYLDDLTILQLEHIKAAKT